MKKIILLLSILLTSASVLFSQSKSNQKIANDLFKDTKEICFEFAYTTKSQLSELTKIISIDHGSTSTLVKAYASKEGFLKFLDYSIPYTITKRPNQLSTTLNMIKGDVPTRAAVSAYPTYPAYIAMMQQFALDYPSLCTYYDLGTLPSGRKIVILKISDNVSAKENEPAFLYTSTMHGDETTGYPMMLSLADYLLSNYGTNARVTNLVNSIEIWINPLANPDGAYAGGDLSVSGAIRYNAAGADLNRNYPDPQDGPHPDGLAWQPETNIFMGLADTMDFVMSANFHGGAEVANYPWDTWNLNHPDENWWVDQCTRYADSAQLNGSPGYMDDLYSGTIPGVTNGFDWYEVNGGRQDYMQWWHQCREFTVELSAVKLIPDAQLVAHYNYNLPSLLNYMEASLFGIRGIVTDGCTGQPMRAKVFINTHDYDSSFVYSSADVGNYHRPIVPGTYSLTFSAPGYISQTVSGVNVATYSSTTILNRTLMPAPPVTNFISSAPIGCTGTIDFTDITGGVTAWVWDFGDGFTSTLQNPSHTYAASGTYTVTLTTTNCAGTDAEVKLNYITVSVSPAPATTNDTTFSCSPTIFNLAATGTGTLNWYDAPIAGTLVNTGTTYTTPTLSSTTAYYVESATGSGSVFGAAPTNTMGTGGYYTAGTYHYLEFTSTSAFTLLTVRVYANTNGNRTIQLRDNTGTILQTTTVFIPTGMSTVTLNFSVPVGTDLQLGTAGGITNNLYRNSSGASYPYAVGTVASITGNSAGNPAYYYYFYNWEISSTCSSARTPVYAVFNSAIGAASISTTTTDNSVCAGSTVMFTATPTNGGSTPTYQWQLNGSNVGTNSPTYTNSSLANGDVVTCILTSSDPCVSPASDTAVNITMTIFALPSAPVITVSGVDLTSSSSTGNQWYLDGSPIGGATGVNYTALSNGLYYSIVTDVNGCTSDTSNQININNVGIKELTDIGLTLYPNPAQTSFTIETNISGNYLLRVIDNLGQTVISENCEKRREQINIQNLKSGLYFVQIKGEKGIVTKKLLVK